jgi:hypothetical protein
LYKISESQIGNSQNSVNPDVHAQVLPKLLILSPFEQRLLAKLPRKQVADLTSNTLKSGTAVRTRD